MQPDDSFRKRQIVLALAGIGLAALLLAVIALRIVTEHSDSNSYALIAQSFLTGQPWVDRCFDFDCAIRDGKSYVIFPPMPGVVAMPLVAAFGIHTIGFMALGAAALAVTLLLWWRILGQLSLDRDQRIWLLAAIAFASPLFFVTFRADRVWFFAQVVAFPFVTLAIHEALARRLVTTGLAIAAAFLSRQMSIFYAPILLLLTFAPAEPLFRIDRPRLLGALKLGLPIAAGLILYFGYNVWRFGSPLDTGYNDIAFPPGMLKARVDQYGLWNKAYLVFNAFYLFLQGFHADFADSQKIALSGLDNAGTGVLAASPWLLLAFFARMNRALWACLALIAGISAVTLFYHSNGFSQFNAQRYVLDWLPAALLIVASGIQRERSAVFKLLVLWGMALNAAAVGVLVLTHTA